MGYARQLMRSSSPHAILNAQNHHDLRQILRLACRQELKLARAPLSCFELLHIDLQEQRSTRGTSERLRGRLTRLCKKAADSLAIAPYIRISPTVPKECGQRLRQAQKIIAYKNSARWPEN